jgi:aryl-alcohol dehydrogenase-like predicted oxidoreductase
MRYRTFGRSGLRVSEMFLGTMTFGTEWGWGASAGECGKLLGGYAEAGGNVIDTANAYTNGASERIVGELLGTGRDRFVLATKYTMTSDGTDPNASGNHRKSLRGSLEQSLRRLRTDYIDLLWVHIWDPDTPVEEMMRALDDAVRAGKVLYVGISDTPAWVVSRANTLADWHGWSPFIGVQLPYSLVQREVERELLPMADTLGLSAAVWSPLAAGVLTGKFTRGDASGSADGRTRVDPGRISTRDRRIATEVDAVADQLGVTSSQVALAWLLARRPQVHPIIGARRLDQLASNLAALDVALPADAARRLDEVSAIDPGFPQKDLETTRGVFYGPVSERTDRRAAR